MRPGRTSVAAVAALALAVSPALRPRVGADDLSATVERVSERVAQNYANAQSIVALDTVRVQPETRNMSPDGFARVLVYDLRIDWTPSLDGGEAEAKVMRQLLTVNGKPPKKGDDECTDPEEVSPEPMMMFLPGRREEFVFSLSGKSKTDGRNSIRIEYKTRASKPPVIKWKDKTCVSVNPGRSWGQVWVDAETNDVLRLDESLARTEFDVPPEHWVPGSFSTMVLEQALTTTHYQAVNFHDPEERLMLPKSIESSAAWSHTRLRITETFSKYRRYVGDSHLLPAGADR